MTKRIKKPTEVVTMRDTALAFTDGDVNTMCLAIDASLDRRDAIELAPAGSSWDKAYKQVQASKVAVARFFLALGVEPANVFERRLVEGKMFNAKSIKKIVEMARYVVGIGEKMERVTRAFIACALIADDKDNGRVFTNTVNAKFLNASDLSALSTDPDLLDHIDALRHNAMSTGAATQSSQMRNVLDVLGLGTVTKVDRERDAVIIHRDAPFYGMFRASFLEPAAA